MSGAWSVILVAVGTISTYTLGAWWCLSYCLDCIIGKGLPWYTGIVAGFFLGEITIPGALFCYILKSLELEAPFAKVV